MSSNSERRSGKEADVMECMKRATGLSAQEVDDAILGVDVFCKMVASINMKEKEKVKKQRGKLESTISACDDCAGRVEELNSSVPLFTEDSADILDRFRQANSEMSSFLRSMTAILEGIEGRWPKDSKKPEQNVVAEYVARVFDAAGLPFSTTRDEATGDPAPGTYGEAVRDVMSILGVTGAWRRAAERYSKKARERADNPNRFDDDALILSDSDRDDPWRI